ncbi:hypothetical protein [Providencia sp. Me31A]|uniref:hypothetical protein n=1 Tax=Providencia sp. Me31A TaxID=3392637 RepID=UPI003D29D67D
MDIVSKKHNIVLLSINYDDKTNVISYGFSFNKETKFFMASIFEAKGIKGINYTDELDKLIMSIMPCKPEVSKFLSEITWGYIEGRNISLPANLI